jgi:hypothetical protein
MVHSTNIMFLDITNHPVCISQYNVSEIGFCLRLQVKPIQFDPLEELVHISGHLHQHEEYTSQAQHKSSAKAKTKY